MKNDKLICQAVSLMEEAVTVIEGIEWPADHTSPEKWLDKVTSWAIDAREAINSHTSFDLIYVQKFFQSALSLVEDAGFTGTYDDKLKWMYGRSEFTNTEWRLIAKMGTLPGYRLNFTPNSRFADCVCRIERIAGHSTWWFSSYEDAEKYIDAVKRNDA